MLAGDLDSYAKLQLAHALRVADLPPAASELGHAAGVDLELAPDALRELVATGLALSTPAGLCAGPPLLAGDHGVLMVMYVEDRTSVLALLSAIRQTRCEPVTPPAHPSDALRSRARCGLGLEASNENAPL